MGKLCRNCNQPDKKYYKLPHRGSRSEMATCTDCMNERVRARYKANPKKRVRTENFYEPPSPEDIEIFDPERPHLFKVERREDWIV